MTTGHVIEIRNVSWCCAGYDSLDLDRLFLFHRCRGKAIFSRASELEVAVKWLTE
jgi:hypothetical protein